MTVGRSLTASGLRERVEQQSEVVAAEITHDRHQQLVVDVGDRALEAAAVLALEHPRADLVDRRADHPLVLLVGHRIDPASEPAHIVKPGEPASILDGDHVPAGGLEHARQPRGGDGGHHPVKRLTVDVDDPQHLAKLGAERVDDRLPDGVSSSSASPTSDTWRPPRGTSKWPGTQRWASADQIGAVAPIPTEPVEKSAGTESLRRLG